MDLLIVFLIIVIYCAGLAIFLKWLDVIVEYATGTGLFDRIRNVFKK